MANIIIAGDSWGCGEWGFLSGSNRYVNTHKGLEEYLIADGHTVTNVSQGAASNTQAIEYLINAISSNNRYDFILWFQTEPLRCLGAGNKKFNNFTTINDLFLESRRLLNQTYNLINCSVEQPVYCIGGCFKLHEDINNYSHLIPVVPSVVELFIPGYTHNIWFSNWVDYISKNFVELDELVEMKKELKLVLAQNQKLFWPDGAHINRKGHWLLYEKIRYIFNS